MALAPSRRVPNLRPIRMPIRLKPLVPLKPLPPVSMPMKLMPLASLRSLKPLLQMRATPKETRRTSAQEDRGELSVGDIRGSSMGNEALEDFCFPMNGEKFERWKFGEPGFGYSWEDSRL